MSLHDDLLAIRKDFQRKAPPGRDALYDAKVQEMKRTFPVEKALKAGAQAPAFTLPDTAGRPVSLADILRHGPAAIVFYRGGWCPYCNAQLRAYERALPGIQAQGGTVLAISPELPANTRATAEANRLTFPVLSDAGNQLAQAFGIAYTVAPEIQDALRSGGKALPGINGDDTWRLPLAATFVIAPDGTVALASVELDYRERAEPEAVLAAMRALRPLTA